MIRRLHVFNFRSLRDVTIEFDQITVLIGRSGAGKTSLVNAIRFLRELLISRQTNLVNSPSWPRVMFEGTQSGSNAAISVEVDFELPGQRDKFGYALQLRPQVMPGGPLNQGLPSRVGLEVLRAGSRVVFQQRDGNWEPPPAVVRFPSPGTLTLGMVYGIPESQVAYQFLSRGIGCYDFASTVLAQQNALASNVQVVPEMQSGLVDSGSNYLRVFSAINENIAHPMALQEIMGALRRLNPTVTTLELELPGRMDILVGHRVGEAGQIMTLSLAQESEGFRRLLAHLLAIYQMPPKQTLIFEEPEKGIYPGALEMLAEYLKKAAKRGSQVILTTQNPLLLDHFNPENVRVVYLENLETRIGRISGEQLQSIREELMTTGELLTVDEARPEGSNELSSPAPVV